jgi:hypothetical protein
MRFPDFMRFVVQKAFTNGSKTTLTPELFARLAGNAIWGPKALTEGTKPVQISTS